MTFQRLGVILMALFFFGTFVVSNLAGLLVDWIWFGEVGYGSVFKTILSTKILLGLVTGFLFFLAVQLTFLAFRKTLGRRNPLPNLPLTVSGLGLAVSFFVAYLGIMLGAGQWESFLRFLHGVPFGVVDPVFNRDAGYYIFDLPALQFIVMGVFALIFLCGGITLAGQYLTGGFSIAKIIDGEKVVPDVRVTDSARRNLSLLGFFFFLVTAAKIHFVDIPEILYSSTGSFTGASYTDLHANLPLKNILQVMALGVALTFLVNLFRPALRLVGLSVAFYFFFSFVVGAAAPALLQKFIVLPNELVKETPYLTRNIEFTRRAFGLGAVAERDLPGDTSISLKDIHKNQSTIRNVRLWEREPLLDTLSQLQEIRTYYQFNSVDDDRYHINGEYRQVLLSPRELDSDSLPQKNFINEHLTFTHGYGLAMSPVNEVTPEGLPMLLIKDLPPASASPELRVTRPGIYFGELVNDWVIVNTRAKEFDYPSGEQNILNHYEGRGGIQLSSFFRKVLFTLHTRNLKVLLSNDLKQDSRIMLYRNVERRVRKVVPFLKIDSDPYLVVTKTGELKWILDGYTSSDRFPYAQRVTDGRGGRLNYIRNSVKIVVDAYDGKMDFYTADPLDAMIKTYEKIFPGVFKPLTELSEDLRAHIRYPEEIFDYQTRVYSVYHMDDIQAFYNKEDQWSIPNYSRGHAGPMMRHIIMKLPEEKKEEFILMLPFTPRGKDNLAAWMVARNDGEHYGQLIVYRFPKQKLVFGPTQITNRINQDAEISRQISLWDQKGSQVIRGSLLVIPVEKSLLYVQPIYLKAEGGRIPELKRVIVAYENQISMEETLEGALERLFGGRVTTARRTVTDSAGAENPLKEELRRARQHFDRALDAMRQGNWTLYGEEIKKLGDLLRRAE